MNPTILISFFCIPLYVTVLCVSWHQEDFQEGENIKDNFANWNIFKYSWGFDEDLAIVIDHSLQVFYPEGSYSPSHKPGGGMGFYASPVDLENIAEVTLEYEVMFGSEFDFVKGGKLPGLFGGGTSCSGGAESEECFSTRFMWRREGAESEECFSTRFMWRR